jgi:hypothetical protein
MSRNEILISIAKKNGFMISTKNQYNRHFREANRLKFMLQKGVN